MNKQFWSTVFTLSGSVIGAGILGLPYVFSQAGFLAGSLWLFFLGAVILLINLYLAEITIMSKGVHQVSGYAHMYLGSKGRFVAVLAVLFGVYAALLAYLVGEGQSLAALIPGVSPFVLGILFWLCMTLLLRRGLEGLKRVESYGVIAITLIILWLFVSFSPQISLENLLVFDIDNFTFPLGVTLFALMGFNAIPEMRREIIGQEKNLKKAVIIGTLIPVALYFIFSFTFVGVLGSEVPEIATLSFGKLIALLGVFTMLTSYLLLSFALSDMFSSDLGFSSRKTFFLSSMVPLFLFVLVSFFDLAGFTAILGTAGVISAGATGIIILLMSKKAKGSSPKGLPINWPIVLVLSALFVIATIFQFVK